jgi:hypothetical protein
MWILDLPDVLRHFFGHLQLFERVGGPLSRDNEACVGELVFNGKVHSGSDDVRDHDFRTPFQASGYCAQETDCASAYYRTARSSANARTTTRVYRDSKRFE